MFFFKMFFFCLDRDKKKSRWISGLSIDGIKSLFFDITQQQALSSEDEIIKIVVICCELCIHY